MIPVIIGCMGGGAKKLREQVEKILVTSDIDKIWREMLRTTVMESESLLRKIITGIVAGEF